MQVMVIIITSIQVLQNRTTMLNDYNWDTKVEPFLGDRREDRLGGIEVVGALLAIPL